MAVLPADETPDLSVFDRFATAASVQVSRAPFFAFCVLLIVIWLPTLPLVGDFATWSLWINNPSTVITFLLVSLSANWAARADKASQLKQNAFADALADLCEELADQLDIPRLADHAAELRQAVGLEDRVSS